MTTRIGRPIGHITIPVLLLGGLLAPAQATAQDPIVPLQFSSSDPGARSMGFGGAFVALADDATAAFANPAGLTQLVKPEISVEGRRWNYSTPFTVRGRVEGLPSGFGIDTIAGLRTATSETAVTGLSFLSLTYPGGSWSLAVFRHELANLEFSGETDGLFGGGSNCCQTRFYDQRMTSELKVVSHGISGAYRLHDRLEVGFGLIYHRSSLASGATMYLPDDDSPEGFFAPTSYLPERALVSERVFGEDSNWGLIGGFLWRPSSSWRIGGVYRQGPRLALSTERTAGEAGDLGVPPGEVLSRTAVPTVELPWFLGLGVAYRAPDGGLTLSFQWDFIPYSTLVESAGLDEVAVDDAHELHLGGEYVFLSVSPVIAVRFGAWLDPDHQVRATGDDPFLRALLPPEEDQLHFTAGLGVAFRSFQIDFGFDLADQLNVVSLSAIYSF